MMRPPPLCYGGGGVVDTLLDGLCKGGVDDMSNQYRDNPELSRIERKRSSSPVVDSNEKASEMASMSKAKRKKRSVRTIRTTKEAPSSSDENKCSPGMQRSRISSDQWRRMARQAKTAGHNINSKVVRSTRPAIRGTSGRKIRKRANSECAHFKPAHLDPIIEIQESMLSQDTLSFFEIEDMQLTQELKSMLSQMSHDLSLVPTVENEEFDEDQSHQGMEHESEEAFEVEEEDHIRHLLDKMDEETVDDHSSTSDSEFTVQIDASGDCSTETEILLIEGDNFCLSTPNHYTITTAAE